MFVSKFSIAVQAIALILFCTSTSRAIEAREIERTREESTRDEQTVSRQIEVGKLSSSLEHMYAMISHLVDEGHKDAKCDETCLQTLRSLEKIIRQKAELGLSENPLPEKAVSLIQKAVSTGKGISDATETVLSSLDVNKADLIKCAAPAGASECPSVFYNIKAVHKSESIRVADRMGYEGLIRKVIKPMSGSYWMPNFRELYEFKIGLRSNSIYGDPQVPVSQAQISVSDRDGATLVNLDFGDIPDHDFKAILPIGWETIADGDVKHMDSVKDFRFPWSATEKRSNLKIVEIFSLANRIKNKAHYLAPQTSGTIARRGQIITISQSITDVNPTHKNYTVTRRIQIEVTNTNDPLHSISNIKYHEDVQYPGNKSFRTVQLESQGFMN